MHRVFFKIIIDKENYRSPGKIGRNVNVLTFEPGGLTL